MNNGKEPIRVVIADDHEVTRLGIRALLEADPGILVVGEASNGADAQKLVAELHPDVLLLDLVMPDLRPFQIHEWVRANCPETTVLILTAHDLDCYLAKAIAGGTAGFLNKKEPSAQLLEAIYRAAQGELLFTTEQYQRANRWQREVGAAVDCLTRREHQVLGLLAGGLPNQAIAEQLSMSVRTVETHLANIMQRLNLASRGEIIAWAHAHLPDMQPDGSLLDLPEGAGSCTTGRIK